MIVIVFGLLHLIISLIHVHAALIKILLRAILKNFAGFGFGIRILNRLIFLQHFRHVGILIRALHANLLPRHASILAAAVKHFLYWCNNQILIKRPLPRLLRSGWLLAAALHQ